MIGRRSSESYRWPLCRLSLSITTTTSFPPLFPPLKPPKPLARWPNNFLDSSCECSSVGVRRRESIKESFINWYHEIREILPPFPLSADPSTAMANSARNTGKTFMALLLLDGECLCLVESLNLSSKSKLNLNWKFLSYLYSNLWIFAKSLTTDDNDGCWSRHKHKDIIAWHWCTDCSRYDFGILFDWHQNSYEVGSTYIEMESLFHSHSSQRKNTQVKVMSLVSGASYSRIQTIKFGKECQSEFDDCASFLIANWVRLSHLILTLCRMFIGLSYIFLYNSGTVTVLWSLQGNDLVQQGLHLMWRCVTKNGGNKNRFLRTLVIKMATKINMEYQSLSWICYYDHLFTIYRPSSYIKNSSTPQHLTSTHHHPHELFMPAILLSSS